ncbi:MULTISPECIES: CaiB/BaiF CoA transferase family protein [Rhodococcus]|uniref:CaiB/BaiF CoA transferase family protein n=1 Tax=Rhodococcus TaxID=1827 RepID=UPI00071D81D6|nr:MULTISPECIES: CoA transferase [Rhodococcus]ANQ75628.1 formyl-CoA transferase [Rhodococcus sp. 008]KSU70615.1 formyl-CoA transferase [Rhodococcus qingshengii]SCC64222.1 formyl-CoA transferase [Rhodococcus qingshengii]
MHFHETYAGLRVLDLSENIAGPLACLILADMGADVVKIERPVHGDATRSLPPYWAGEATVFHTVNRNKRSAAIDLKSGAGRDAVLRLAASADVVVESFRPGVASRLGLGFEEMTNANPTLVHVSVNAFGTGPLGHDRPGYDALVQAFTGIMEMTGEPDGEPVRAAPSVIDISTGLWAALAVQGALVRRDKSGEAQKVEATLIDTGLFMMCHQIIGYLGTGTFPGRLGSAAPSAAPYQIFSTSDRPIMIATSTDRMFTTLCRTLGPVELATDARFVTMDRRLANRDELAALLQDILVTKGSGEWLDIISAAGIPVGPVNDLAETLAHPLTLERNMIAPAEEGRIADLVQIHLPMDGERSASRRQAPSLGEHTETVLAEAGFTPDEVAAVIQASARTKGPELA